MALETRMISTRITLMFADFNGRPRQQYALSYDEHTGSLVSDEGRNIAKIEYDNFNNPIRIQFTNGNVTKYVYSAAGEKLKVIYQTAVPNISVAIGSKRELTASQVQYTDSIDYLLGGSLTLRNGRIDQYQFEEGYCQAEVYSSTIDKFAFCYYDQDHLGNIRQVTKADGSTKGKVVQKVSYYPFGLQLCDGTTDSNVQSHKYNGKELDKMHGLNTYDYGARQYNPVTARWDRMDPHCESYYFDSPYSYCKGNPVCRIDPDGKDDYFNLFGTYLGTGGNTNNVVICKDKGTYNKLAANTPPPSYSYAVFTQEDFLRIYDTTIYAQNHPYSNETGFVRDNYGNYYEPTGSFPDRVTFNLNAPKERYADGKVILSVHTHPNEVNGGICTTEPSKSVIEKKTKTVTAGNDQALFAEIPLNIIAGVLSWGEKRDYGVGAVQSWSSNGDNKVPTSYGISIYFEYSNKKFNKLGDMDVKALTAVKNKIHPNLSQNQ